MKTKEEIIHYMKDKMFVGNENLNKALAFLYAKGILVDDITVFTHVGDDVISANDFITWFNEEPKEGIDKTEKDLVESVEDAIKNVVISDVVLPKCEQFLDEITEIVDAMDEAFGIESKVINAKPMFKSEAQIKVDETEKLIDNSKPIQFRLLANSISDLYEEKNKAYGDSFGKSVKKYGLVSALTRMSDKWNRLENLILNNERENDESLEDTLKDLASYCLMTVMELGDGNE